MTAAASAPAEGRPGVGRAAALLTAAFVLLMAAGLGLSAWITEKQQAETHRLARRWSAAEVARLAETVRHRLQGAERVLRTLAASPRDATREEPSRARARRLVAFLRGFDPAAFVYAAFPDGSSHGAQRLLSGRIELFMRSGPEAPARLWWLGEDGQARALEEGDPVPFDPREARWYRRARKESEIAWSRPYGGIGKASILTASLEAGSAVYGVDVSLAGIGAFMDRRRGPTAGSSVFLLDADGEPIQGLTRSAERGHEKALDLFLQSGAGALERLDADTPVVRGFGAGGQRLVGAVRAIRLGERTVGAVALLTPLEEFKTRLRLTVLRVASFALVGAGLLAGLGAIGAVGLGRRRAAVAQETADDDGSASAVEERAPPAWPARLVACLAGLDEEAQRRRRAQAETKGFSVIGEMPGRLLLCADGAPAERALVDFALSCAEEAHLAAGLAAETGAEADAAPAARLAERLAATPGAVNAPETVAAALASRYGVMRRGAFFLEGMGTVTVCDIEVEA
jgi:hypothetical protein